MIIVVAVYILFNVCIFILKFNFKENLKKMSKNYSEV